MPRKRRPITILRIERLSDGKVYMPPTGTVDDWGEPIVQPIDNTPARPVPDIDDIKAERKRAEREQARALLQAVLPQVLPPVPMQPKLVMAEVKGMRPIGKLGERVIYVPKADWRRI